MVLQQHLDVANALLCANKGERDHSLCQQNKTTHTSHVSIGLTSYFHK